MANDDQAMALGKVPGPQDHSTPATKASNAVCKGQSRSEILPGAAIKTKPPHKPMARHWLISVGDGAVL